MLIDVPGVGVSLISGQGYYLFMNSTAMRMLFRDKKLDYHGKSIRDFPDREFAKERLQLISDVLQKGRASRFRHFYNGRLLESKIWPLYDKDEPHDRVLAITREMVGLPTDPENETSVYESEFVELGEFNILSQRELEVFVLLGHGMSVPNVARTLHRSPKTIERHKYVISEKLGLHGQAEMARLVAMVGLTYDHAKLKRVK